MGDEQRIDEYELIRRQKAQGKSAIEVQRWLRENGYAIPWVQTVAIYNNV